MLTLLYESRIEFFHNKVVLNGRKHRHIEHGSDWRPSTSDAAPSLHPSAVVIKGGQAAICLLVSIPSSGSSPNKVKATPSPIPGTELNN